MGVISVENLTKHYGRRVGIDRLSFTVSEGEVFGFLGPNGSGKTTTIRLLLALLRPTAGRATVFGIDCWRGSRRIKAELGYVPGDLRLHGWMTVRDAMRITARVRARDLEASCDALTGQFDLDPDVRVRHMSRGMRQKFGLILALAHHPKLIVLDEPTSALDPLMQSVLFRHLRERASNGATVLFSSHTLSVVEELCDRVAILRSGRLVADERIEALRARARRDVIIRWNHEDAMRQAALPTSLRVTSRNGLQWRCALSGPVMEAVRWCASQPLADLSIGRPDLDSLFRQYYHEDDETK